MDPVALTAQLKQAAQSLGFKLTGACPAVTPPGAARLASWLAAGYAGGMTYLAERETAYGHPCHVLSGARSLLMLGMSYSAPVPPEAKEGRGRIARYAAEPGDYHDDIHKRLKKLCRLAAQLQPGVRVRGVVDTAPLLEREFAQLAGLGWIGKNTMLLNRQHGSWFFLAALLLDCELDYDVPVQSEHCGRCTACLEACPTRAFSQPFVLDATRCISYLTIELRGPIPRELRPRIGNRLFGCDVCQEVCPWNRKAAKTRGESVVQTSKAELTLPLHDLFELTELTFREQFRHTVFWRCGRRGLLRNAAIVLGNQASPASHESLARGLEDLEPLVRGAAAWALGRIGTAQAFQTLKNRLAVEDHETVRDELVHALDDVARQSRNPDRR